MSWYSLDPSRDEAVPSRLLNFFVATPTSGTPASLLSGALKYNKFSYLIEWKNNHFVAATVLGFEVLFAKILIPTIHQFDRSVNWFEYWFSQRGSYTVIFKQLSVKYACTVEEKSSLDSFFIEKPCNVLPNF